MGENPNYAVADGYEPPSIETAKRFARSGRFRPGDEPDDEFIEMWWWEMQAADWYDDNGRRLTVGRWQRSLGAWWQKEKEIRRARQRTEYPADVLGYENGQAIMNFTMEA